MSTPPPAAQSPRKPYLGGDGTAQKVRRGATSRRIVLTGGPGGGKTTAADLFQRELGNRVMVVPEAATLLFRGGFPRCGDADVVRPTQQAIFHVQRSLEEAQSAAHPSRVLLCDRGTVDGAAYWPKNGRDDDFFEALGTSLEQELARYGAVVFFESAAVGGLAFHSGNPIRVESNTEAAALDQRLRELWSHHPRFVLIPHEASFFRKIAAGLDALNELVGELEVRRSQ